MFTGQRCAEAGAARAEVHEPVRAAVLQWGQVLGTLGTAGPGLEVLG